MNEALHITVRLRALRAGLVARAAGHALLKRAVEPRLTLELR